MEPGTCVAPSSLWLATGLGSPSTIAVDATNVYWLNQADDSVNAMPKNGGPVVPLASNQYDLSTQGWQMALDDTYVYWVANGILRARKDGTGTAQTVTAATGLGLSVDSTNVYFAGCSSMPQSPGSCLNSPSTIYTVPKSGGTRAILAQIPGEFYAMTSDGTSLYLFFFSGLPEVDRIDPPFNSMVRIGGLGCPPGPSCGFLPGGQMAVDQSYVYALTLPVSSDGSLLSSFSKAGGRGPVNIVGHFEAFTPGPCGVIVAPPGSADAGAGIELEVLPNANPTATLAGANAVAMAFDGTYLYWSDPSGAIGRIVVK